VAAATSYKFAQRKIAGRLGQFADRLEPVSPAAFQRDKKSGLNLSLPLKASNLRTNGENRPARSRSARNRIPGKLVGPCLFSRERGAGHESETLIVSIGLDTNRPVGIVKQTDWNSKHGDKNDH
jgi:hypothetical protein